jgi:hypothetical protein
MESCLVTIEWPLRHCSPHHLLGLAGVNVSKRVAASYKPLPSLLHPLCFPSRIELHAAFCKMIMGVVPLRTENHGVHSTYLQTAQLQAYSNASVQAPGTDLSLMCSVLTDAPNGELNNR